MTNSNTIRWGILGTGHVAKLFAMGLEFLPEAQLLAVASRTKKSAVNFAGEFGVPRQYSCYEELVKDSDVDVVYIATPQSLHCAHCILCLDEGKAVLCEKPFTVNASDAKKVVSYARNKNLFVMEAMWMRFLPVIRSLPAIIAQADIGELCALQANFGVPTFTGNRQPDPALGEGALLELGVYTLSLASLLFGAPRHIDCQATISARGVDEQSSIILRYSSGQIASLYASLKTAPPNDAVILGTRGELRIHAPFYRPHKISFKRFCVDSVPLQPKKGKLFMIKKNFPFLQDQFLRFERFLPSVLTEKRNTVVLPFRGNGYNYEAEEVMNCLRAGKTESDIMPLDETLKIIETTDVIRAKWDSL